MRKRELTTAQKEYRRFDTRRGIIIKTLIGFLIAILVCFVAAFRVVDNDPAPLLFLLGILIVYTIITIFICRYLTRKHGQLYVAAYGNDTDVIRNGLFGELWQEFEWNQYEGLTDGSGEFAIGIIEKTFRNKLYFKPFDADGVWDDVGLEIPYSQITTVKWATRYADVWQKYLQHNSLCP